MFYFTIPTLFSLSELRPPTDYYFSDSQTMSSIIGFDPRSMCPDQFDHQAEDSGGVWSLSNIGYPLVAPMHIDSPPLVCRALGCYSNLPAQWWHLPEAHGSSPDRQTARNAFLRPAF